MTLPSWISLILFGAFLLILLATAALVVRGLLPTVLVGFLVALVQGAQAQEMGEEGQWTLPELEVIGVTPQHGTGLPKDRVPANVQTYSAEAMDRIQTPDFTELMRRRASSVHTNTLGGNPLQPDVSLRGFRGSPLLGLPQGISVYQDGVRINETFGDVVNWDLVPQFALANIETMGGSNPLFGLNTLGGAISLQTKSGFSHPIRRVSAEGGAWGRYEVIGEAGTHTDETGFYIGGKRFKENGWRDFSQSEANTSFGKLSWRGQDTALDVAVNTGDTDLRGNGAVPLELLRQDREAVFTHPDITENDMQMVTVSGSHFVTETIQVNGNVYFRRTDTHTFNGDDSDFEECEEAAQSGLLCAEDGEGEVVQNVVDGGQVVATEGVESATLNTSDTRQDTLGGTLQGTFNPDVMGMANQLIVGVTANIGDTAFTSRTELGRLTNNRGAEGSGIVVRESLTEVDAEREDFGYYLTDTLSITDRLSLTFSGRYNGTRVRLKDQIGSALTGTHSFQRFNPAGGLTYRFHSLATAFASWSQSNRAPTPVELTCADPNDPCRLPNGFQADPPLEQPVAQTAETGLRGGNRDFQYSLVFFRTQIRDDIYFISAGPGQPRNAGFFDNIGDTRRVGVELSAHGLVPAFGPIPGTLRWFVSWTHLDATFQEDFRVNSPAHPEADANNEIPVRAGDTLPLIPEQIAKGGLDWQVTRDLSFGFDVVYNSEQYLRGDEANQLEPIDAYAILNLRGAYRFTDWLRMFARVDNVLDNKFSTAGLLGEPDEVAGFEDFESSRFLTPGPPIGGWVGVELAF